MNDNELEEILNEIKNNKSQYSTVCIPMMFKSLKRLLKSL